MAKKNSARDREESQDENKERIYKKTKGKNLLEKHECSRAGLAQREEKTHLSNIPGSGKKEARKKGRGVRKEKNVMPGLREPAQNGGGS